MGQTAENVAEEFKVSRADQDAFGLRSQAKASAAGKNGRLAREIVPVTIPAKKGDPVIVDRDEHPRETTLEALAKLKPIVKPEGTVTAGNASGVNDGACAVLISPAEAAKAPWTRRWRAWSGSQRPGARRASWEWARYRQHGSCWSVPASSSMRSK
jgi:acetyl-CoA acetyltransferase